jgi:hypothetical protein
LPGSCVLQVTHLGVAARFVAIAASQMRLPKRKMPASADGFFD